MFYLNQNVEPRREKNKPQRKTKNYREAATTEKRSKTKR
jgi:hypothetical protein